MTDDRRCGEDMAHDEKTCGFNCGEGIGKPATLDGAREAFKAMEATVVKELRSDKATFVPCIDCGGEGSHYEGCALRTSEVTREPVPTEVHERGWQWRPVGDDGAFAPPFGTVRACRVCDCLVAGGPTVCGRCANDGDDRNADHAAAEIERAERVSAEAIPQRDIYDDCAQDLQVILTESGNLTTLAVNAGMATAPALDIRDRIGGAVSRMTHKLHAHVTTPRRERATTWSPKRLTAEDGDEIAWARVTLRDGRKGTLFRADRDEALVHVDGADYSATDGEWFEPGDIVSLESLSSGNEPEAK